MKYIDASGNISNSAGKQTSWRGNSLKPLRFTGTGGGGGSAPPAITSTRFKAVAWKDTSGFTAGFTAQATSDTDGGLEANVGAQFNYAHYRIYPLTGGTLTFSFRVASTASTSFHFLLNGSTVGDVTVPNTGGLTTYQTITANFTVGNGPQEIGVQLAGTASFVLNWIEYNDVSLITPKAKTINSVIGGFVEVLPDDYGSTTTNYPLIIMTHGIGEMGNGNTDLHKLYENTGCLTNIIYAGSFPHSFLSGGSGASFKFIMVMPQFNAWNQQGTDITELQDMYAYALANYRVDTHRVYFTGLSMGGGILWDHIGAAGKAAQYAAVVPMCGAADATTAGATNIAATNLPIWAFHNSADPTVPESYTEDWFTQINGHTPSPLMKKTVPSSGAHDVWTLATDPTYRESSMNIYEWMLQYTR